eukprot:366223-Chlamydomonas_euryale.AAC.5
MTQEHEALTRAAVLVAEASKGTALSEPQWAALERDLAWLAEKVWPHRWVDHAGWARTMVWGAVWRHRRVDLRALCGESVAARCSLAYRYLKPSCVLHTLVHVLHAHEWSPCARAREWNPCVRAREWAP